MNALLLILGYLFELKFDGLFAAGGGGGPQAVLGAAAGDDSGKTVQPGAVLLAPGPPEPDQLWLDVEGGGGAVAAFCSAVSQGSRS